MFSYVCALFMASALGLISGCVFSYFNPLVPLSDVWSSRYYFDTQQGEYEIDTVISIRGRDIFSSSVISDAKGKAVAARSAKMSLQTTLRADGTNLYTLQVDYSKPFPNLDEPALANQTAFFSLVRARFYRIDCNQFVMDMQPAPHVSYSPIFRRISPRRCDSGSLMSH